MQGSRQRIEGWHCPERESREGYENDRYYSQQASSATICGGTRAEIRVTELKETHGLPTAAKTAIELLLNSPKEGIEQSLRKAVCMLLLHDGPWIEATVLIPCVTGNPKACKFIFWLAESLWS